MDTKPGYVRLRRSALALAVLLVSGAALAGPPGDAPAGAYAGTPRWHDGPRHGPPGAEQHLARLDEALNLSDAQSAELLALLQTAEAERQALHERIMAEYRPEICALTEETEAGIVAVLTPEQAATFDELKAGRHDRFAGHRGHGFAGFGCDAADD